MPAAPKKQPASPEDPYATLPDTSAPTAAEQDPYATMPDSFAATPENKEGVYKMHSLTGTIVRSSLQQGHGSL